MKKDHQDLRNKVKGFGLNLDLIIQEAQEQIVEAIWPEILSWIESSVKANVPTNHEIVEYLPNEIPEPRVLSFGV